MSDEEKKQRQAEREARIERILDLALALTEDRLENVDPKERKDNVAFDRVARTAQAFLRLADDADAISARKRKEDAAHDEGVQVRLPDEDEVDSLEQRLAERVARSRGRPICGRAETVGEQPAAAEGMVPGRIA